MVNCCLILLEQIAAKKENTCKTSDQYQVVQRKAVCGSGFQPFVFYQKKSVTCFSDSDIGSFGYILPCVNSGVDNILYHFFRAVVSNDNCRFCLCGRAV